MTSKGRQVAPDRERCTATVERDGRQCGNPAVPTLELCQEHLIDDDGDDDDADDAPRYRRW